MRWVEGDYVKLDPHHGTAYDQARQAIQERFPEAWKWYVGFQTPGMIHGEALRGIIHGEEPEEVEEWQADYEQVRSMVQFLLDNWIEAGRVQHFGYDEWNLIFKALRYCAQNIGHISESAQTQGLREASRLLSARLVGEGYVQVGDPDSMDEKHDNVIIFDSDWKTILYACMYAWKNMKAEEPKMVEFKESLDKLTPQILKMVKKREMSRYTSYGYSDIEIYRSLNEIEIEPWNYQGDRDKEKEKYRELRRLQGDTEENDHDSLHVLRFSIKDGANVELYDKFGVYKDSHTVEPGEYLSFSGWDLDFQFNSDVFTFGKGRADRLVASTEDVVISESDIHCTLKQLPEWIDYIYANYTVKKYKTQ